MFAAMISFVISYVILSSLWRYASTSRSYEMFAWIITVICALDVAFTLGLWRSAL